MMHQPCSPATKLAIASAAQHQREIAVFRERAARLSREIAEQRPSLAQYVESKRCGRCDGTSFTVCGVMCRTCGGRGWR